MSVVSKNIFWLAVSRVLALLLLFFAYTRLFRYLGPGLYGQYQFILSYVLIFSTVVDFGIQQFITKHISEDPENAKKYFHSFFAFEIVAAFILYAAAVGVAVYNRYTHDVFVGICVAAAGMVANALTYPYLAVLSSKQDLRKVAFVNFINSLVNVAVIFGAILLHHGIVFLSAVQVTFGILDLIIYRFLITQHIPHPQIWRVFADYDFGIIKRILVSAWPFALLVGFSAIYNRIDVVIITALKGYVQTGYYGAAYKVFDLLSFFPSTVSFTLFPHFSALMAKRAIDEVRTDLEKYVRLMLAAAVPMAVGGTVLCTRLITLVAGNQFLPSAHVLAIVIWAPAIQFVYIPVNSLVISQLTKKAMAITGTNVIVNIVGNLLLIPHFGIKAAAAMTVVSESLQGIFYFYFVHSSITQFRFFSLVWKPALASLIMGIVLWPMRFHSLFITLASGVAVYALVLLMTGFISKTDWQFAKTLFGPG